MNVLERPKIQSWNASVHVGQGGERLVLSLFEQLRNPNPWFRTVAVQDVTGDPVFQKLGIDFTWFVKAAGCTCAITVEVKTDRNDHTGNFFFETVSDVEQNTLGAFLSSTAEWYFYAFPNTETIYCLPLYETREWFLDTTDQSRERAVGSVRDGRAWQTLGVPVPIKQVISNIPHTKCFIRADEVWNVRV